MSDTQIDDWRLSRGELVEIIDQTTGLDKNSMEQASARWRTLCKPLYSLGYLEDQIVLLSGMQKSGEPKLDRCAVFIFCADNGVVSEGVSQTTQEVTGTVTRNFVKGITTVNAFGRAVGADIFPVDVGIADFAPYEGVFRAKIMSAGTNNILVGPAMSEEQALAALAVGLNRADWAASQGYDICVAGEMGIGNTTTSAAVLSCLLNEDPAELAGRGSGLDSGRLKNKIRVIRGALTINRPNAADPIDTLAKVGGLDLAAMVGFYIGCAHNRLPVILDGMISLTAALVAARVDPLANYYFIASHSPKEPGGAFALRALEKEAYLNLNLANGEGAGALMFLPILRMALAAYNELATFEEGEVEAYQPLF